jgi:quercetin dioxygenase-like cupin family protein
MRPTTPQPQEVTVRWVSLAAIGLLLVFATPALAQDATVVDPDHYTVEFENDQVRVIRISYGPGEKSVMHEHSDAVAVMLSGGTMRMHFPDGTTEDLESNDGDANWASAVTHLPENIGDGRVEVILVEFKPAPEEDCM